MQQQQPQFHPQSQLGQQTGSQQRTQEMGQQSIGRLSPQGRDAFTQVAQAIGVCGWCATQCINQSDPNMIECIRLCEDVVELGEATLALTARNSRFDQSIVQTFQQAVQACAQECSRHGHAHCQECAQVLPQVANSAQHLVQSAGQQSMQ